MRQTRYSISLFPTFAVIYLLFLLAFPSNSLSISPFKSTSFHVGEAKLKVIGEFGVVELGDETEFVDRGEMKDEG